MVVVILRLEVCGSTAALAQVNEPLLSQRKSEKLALVQVEPRPPKALNACSVPAADWVHSDRR